MKLNEVIEAIEELKEIREFELFDEIVTAFGDYNFEGETEVIVSSPKEMNTFSPSEGTHSAYINTEDAPILHFELEEIKAGEWVKGQYKEGIFSVVNCYEV